MTPGSVTLDVDWSNPSTYTTGTGVHHGYATAKVPDSDTYPELASGAVFYNRWPASAWYAKLDPGGFIIPHIDQGPWMERWHYPISGQGRVWQEWDEDGISPMMVDTRLATFAPYRMNHHQPHAVWNPFDYPRVVLIVEYDTPVDQPTADLILCDMIPEIQTMIDNI